MSTKKKSNKLLELYNLEFQFSGVGLKGYNNQRVDAGFSKASRPVLTRHWPFSHCQQRRAWPPAERSTELDTHTYRPTVAKTLNYCHIDFFHSVSALCHRSRHMPIVIFIRQTISSVLWTNMHNQQDHFMITLIKCLTYSYFTYMHVLRNTFYLFQLCQLLPWQ